MNARFNATASTKALCCRPVTAPASGATSGGLVPDVAFRSDGSISPIKTTSWVGGVEQKVSAKCVVRPATTAVSKRKATSTWTPAEAISASDIQGRPAPTIRRCKNLPGPRPISSSRGSRLRTDQRAAVLGRERTLIARDRLGLGGRVHVFRPGALQPAVARYRRRRLCGRTRLVIGVDEASSGPNDRASLISPESVEAIAREFRVAHGVRDVFVSYRPHEASNC